MSTDGTASSRWTPRVEPDPPKQPSVFAGTKVTARIDAPDTVQAGTELVYTLTLSNPSASPVSLDRCPKYSQIFGQGGTATANYYFLNCAQSPTELPANGSIGFEMRILTPAIEAGGTATFSGGADLIWQTDEEESLSEEAKVTVTA